MLHSPAGQTIQYQQGFTAEWWTVTFPSRYCGCSELLPTSGGSGYCDHTGAQLFTNVLIRSSSANDCAVYELALTNFAVIMTEESHPAFVRVVAVLAYLL